MYTDSHYLLTWQSSKGKILLEDDASSENILLAVWQVRHPDIEYACRIALDWQMQLAGFSTPT